MTTESTSARRLLPFFSQVQNLLIHKSEVFSSLELPRGLPIASLDPLKPLCFSQLINMCKMPRKIFMRKYPLSHVWLHCIIEQRDTGCAGQRLPPNSFIEVAFVIDSCPIIYCLVFRISQLQNLISVHTEDRSITFAKLMRNNHNRYDYTLTFFSWILHSLSDRVASILGFSCHVYSNKRQVYFFFFKPESVS